jgi:hypothetical protein
MLTNVIFFVKIPPFSAKTFQLAHLIFHVTGAIVQYLDLKRPGNAENNNFPLERKTVNLI